MIQIKSDHDEFYQIFNASVDGMYVIARDFTVLRVNDAFTNMTGISRESIEGKKCNEVLNDAICIKTDCPLCRVLETNQTYNTNVILKNCTNDSRYYVLTATPLRDSEERVFGVINSFKDITEYKHLEQQLTNVNQTLEKRVADRTKELKQREDQLIRLLYADSLTGLPNRLCLLRDLNKSAIPVVALINIDGFEQINNFYGYTAGDAILSNLARLLSNTLPSKAYHLYRIHADEYAIFLDAKRAANLPVILNDFEQLSRHITALIPATKFTNRNQAVMLRVTMGIAFATDPDPEKLVIKADIALREARFRRKPFLFFKETEEIGARYHDNIKLASILQDAIKHDRIVPYFQPIYNHEQPHSKHYEVLARLIDNSGNVISPFQFINIAKATRQYPAITRAIVQKSFALFKDRPDEISINLDIDDMEDIQTTEMIHTELTKHNIADRVVFEVLENHRLENHTEAVNFLKTLKAAGCKLAVDDFGSGYSNFSYVLSLDFDYLKIDASLIKNIDQDAHSQAIVKSIVTFARDMGIKTIAEFVHSESVFSTVKDYNIDFSQGFYIARPEPWPVN